MDSEDRVEGAWCRIGEPCRKLIGAVSNDLVVCRYSNGLLPYGRKQPVIAFQDRFLDWSGF